jgi:hypothetical protein
MVLVFMLFPYKCELVLEFGLGFRLLLQHRMPALPQPVLHSLPQPVLHSLLHPLQQPMPHPMPQPMPQPMLHPMLHPLPLSTPPK